jgi:hypothetical protein
VDGDLAEAVSALRAAFEQRKLRARFEPAEPALIKQVRESLALTERYAAFLREANPTKVETATPSERIRFVPAAELVREQVGFGVADGTTKARDGWRPGWTVIAHSSLLGDPYFLDTTRPDVEGDCPVMTAMSGAGSFKPLLAASSFACFLRILAAGMEVAAGFASDSLDDQDDAIFREAMSPRVRVIDAAAARAGHWT